MEHGFNYEYRYENVIFYILMVNNQIKIKYMILKLINSSNIHQKFASAEFHKLLEVDDVFNNLWARYFGFEIEIIICQRRGLLLIGIILKNELDIFQ